MMVRMAGLEGIEQPQRRGGMVADRRGPAVEDEQAREALAEYGSPADHEVTIPSRSDAARTVRRLTRLVVVHQWGLSPQLSEVAVLLASELVSNAVLHTGASRFGLRITRTRGRIKVELRDPSRGLPCMLPVQPTDIGGRGLFLVDKLSDRWGADLLPIGKYVWFELRVIDR